MDKKDDWHHSKKLELIYKVVQFNFKHKGIILPKHRFNHMNISLGGQVGTNLKSRCLENGEGHGPR